jgi:heme exporter protein CcmD
MNWSNWDAFVAMGGHGPYVWGSVVAVLGAVGVELVQASRRHQAVLRTLRLQIRGRR